METLIIYKEAALQLISGQTFTDVQPALAAINRFKNKAGLIYVLKRLTTRQLSGMRNFRYLVTEQEWENEHKWKAVKKFHGYT